MKVLVSKAQPLYKFLSNNFILETIILNGLFNKILSIVSGLGAEGEESLFVPTPLLGPFFLSNLLTHLTQIVSCKSS